ncbi:MAG TPA: hypothetical protein VKV35_00590 [Streptosporangiaceae bacterium]|nr:hypothetical protein [Streptosporangiaceae bacterium]
MPPPPTPRGGGHPVTRLEQRGGRHQPGPADQPLQLGLPELRPLAGYRLRAVAADQRERHPGGGHRAAHVARPPSRFRLAGEAGQLGRVEPVAAQEVTAVAVLDPVTAEHRTEPADQHGQLVLGPRGRCAGPHRVDEHARRHGLPGGQGQQVQGQPGLLAAQRLRLDPVHAEVAKHPHGQRPHACIKAPPAWHHQLSARWLQPPPATLVRSYR